MALQLVVFRLLKQRGDGRLLVVTCRSCALVEEYHFDRRACR